MHSNASSRLPTKRKMNRWDFTEKDKFTPILQFDSLFVTQKSAKLSFTLLNLIRMHCLLWLNILFDMKHWLVTGSKYESTNQWWKITWIKSNESTHKTVILAQVNTKIRMEIGIVKKYSCLNSNMLSDIGFLAHKSPWSKNYVLVLL